MDAMTQVPAVTEINARFADDMVAREVATALNQWFRWILEGSQPPRPEFFESLGVDSGEYAWTLEEDVDWELGPHARALGNEVRVALQTQDTHLYIAGLLRRLGGTSARVVRDR